MELKQRLIWADIAKGIGIILVVFAHTLVPQIRANNVFAGFIWIFIYNFHMPLFFFLSGYMFERGLPHYNNKGRFILGKLKFLMIPYLTFSVFAYGFIRIALNIDKLAGILQSGGYGITAIKDSVMQILTYSNHTDQHLWFVYSLFIVFAINICLPKLMKSKPMLLALLGLYVSKAFVHYPGILDYTASDLLFFSLARAMLSGKINITLQSPLKIIAILALFITTNCLYSYFYVTRMPSGVIKGVLYVIRSISSAAGIITVCTLSKFLAKTKISGLFTRIGEYSYDIYLMHAPFLVSGLMGILLSYSSLPTPLCCVAVLIIGIIAPYVISRFVIRKIPVLSLLLLGKNYRSKKAPVRELNI